MIPIRQRGFVSAEGERGSQTLADGQMGCVVLHAFHRWLQICESGWGACPLQMCVGVGALLIGWLAVTSPKRAILMLAVVQLRADCD
jgi:hypothetical protein